jgi:hypothetical protein
VLYIGFQYVTATNPAQGSAMRYNSATDSWGATAPIDFRQGYANPVLLNEGSVFVAGGSANEGISPGGSFKIGNAQIYDPVADRWSSAGAMSTGRGNHTATLLGDGLVLVAGGNTSRGSGPLFATASVERFIPSNGQWVPAGSLARVRAYHTATRLADGRVIVVGGLTNDAASITQEYLATAEVYDPATDRWTPAAAMATPRIFHTATLLGDGRVLVFGGVRDGDYREGTGAEIYDPATNRWTTTRPITPRRYGHGAVALPDGGALIIGGDGTFAVERYDLAQDRWVGLPPHPAGPIARTAQALLDRRVLLIGDSSSSSVLYVPEPGPLACFVETGHCVRGRFLDYWQTHGGLARNGFPLSDERVEVLEDGKAYVVQYFERVRLEYHAENAGTAYQVLLGQFGRAILNQRLIAAQTAPRPSERTYLPVDARQPVEPKPGQSFFGETGHNLGGRFRDYWQANGGLAQFGFPLTEEVAETLEDGNTYTVQYFERARFEYHPEHAGTAYEVLLGQFGREMLAQADRLGGDFGLLYATEPGVRGRLGAPSLPTTREVGATQEFERGRMVYRRAEGNVGLIYVFCGAQQTGRLIGNASSYYFFDGWNEDQDPGGGPAPTPGLFLPQRGFGKVWRENPAVRDCLGYARTANETGYTIAAQQFQAGLMLSEPEGRFVDVVFVEQPCFKCGQFATYERYGVPGR